MFPRSGDLAYTESYFLRGCVVECRHHQLGYKESINSDTQATLVRCPFHKGLWPTLHWLSGSLPVGRCVQGALGLVFSAVAHSKAMSGVRSGLTALRPRRLAPGRARALHSHSVPPPCEVLRPRPLAGCLCSKVIAEKLCSFRLSIILRHHYHQGSCAVHISTEYSVLRMVQRAFIPDLAVDHPSGPGHSPPSRIQTAMQPSVRRNPMLDRTYIVRQLCNSHLKIVLGLNKVASL